MLNSDILHLHCCCKTWLLDCDIDTVVKLKATQSDCVLKVNATCSLNIVHIMCVIKLLLNQIRYKKRSTCKMYQELYAIKY